jgi:hypothetical protein
MNLRRLILAIGAVLLVVGIAALLMPVSVSGPNGESIGCGNAVASDPTAAKDADSKNLANLPVLNEIVPHTSYVAECESALSHRRAWSIPLAAVGAIVAVGALLVRGRPARAPAA